MPLWRQPQNFNASRVCVSIELSNCIIIANITHSVATSSVVHAEQSRVIKTKYPFHIQVVSVVAATDALDKLHIFRVHELTIFGLGSCECVHILILRMCVHCIFTLISCVGLVWLLAEHIHVRYTCHRIFGGSRHMTNVVRSRATMFTRCICSGVASVLRLLAKSMVNG